MHEGAIIAIVVPLISAVATIVSVILSNRSSDKVRETKYQSQMDEIKKDLRRIENKVNEYNELNQRMYAAEEKISVLETRIDHVEHKLEQH